MSGNLRVVASAQIRKVLVRTKLYTHIHIPSALKLVEMRTVSSLTLCVCAGVKTLCGWKRTSAKC